MKTLSEFAVAHNIFASNGIVLSIEIGQRGDLMFDCNYWSCFQNENERVFLGGMTLLQFNTIRDIPLGINYAPYIKILNIFDNMLTGYVLLGIAPTTRDVRGSSKVIDCVIKNNQNKNQAVNATLSIPTYVMFCANIHHFHICPFIRLYL